MNQTNLVTFGFGATAAFVLTLGFGVGAVADVPGRMCVSATLAARAFATIGEPGRMVTTISAPLACCDDDRPC